jgi:hypothetical protein
MPLCIDNTSSEKSRQMVGEHVLECKSCMEMYQEMRTEVPREIPVSKASAPFERAVRHLRKKRRQRRVAATIVGVVLGVVLMLTLVLTYNNLTTDYAKTAADKDYAYRLNRLENGEVVLTHYNLSGKQQKARWKYDETTGILTLSSATSTWAPKASSYESNYVFRDIFWDNDSAQLMIRLTDAWGRAQTSAVKEVYKGGAFNGYGYSYEVLYQHGYDIPLMDENQEFTESGSFDMQFDYVTPVPFVTVAPMLSPTPMPTEAPKEMLFPTPIPTQTPAA